MTVDDELPALLIGAWRVRRRLRDLRGGVEGAFTGTARFEPDGDGLAWSEEGRLRLGGHDGPATRRHAIVRTRAGWMVLFDDGRPFHPLDLARGACAVEHLCGEDRYTGDYRLTGRDALDVRWEVVGPRKQQEIVTAYRRGPAV